MRRVWLAAVATAVSMLAGSAGAAVRTVDFTVNPGSWLQNYIGGVDTGDGSAAVTGSPFGLGLDPTLTGKVTFDDAVSGVGSFISLDYATGTQSWTVAEINSVSAGLVFGGGEAQYLVADFGPADALYNGFALDFTGLNGGGSALVGDNTDGPPTPDSIGIFCNGCVTFSVEDGGAIPEPSAWALMILGFGGAGAALRRRSVMARTEA